MTVTTHNLGFPRIGVRRELKFALEKYWRKEINASQLHDVGVELRKQNWEIQRCLDWQPVGDFSFYDHVLDLSFAIGNVPPRFRESAPDNELDNYFRVARGRSTTETNAVQAGEMTKWLDTNYHYIVPEFHTDTTFSLNAGRLLEQLAEAKAQGVHAKPVIVGPVTYLWLGKSKDGSDKLALLDRLLDIYAELINQFVQEGMQWVQIDEPVLVTELDTDWQQALQQSYDRFQDIPVNLLLTTYFGKLKENLRLTCDLPVTGLHIDTLNAGDEVQAVMDNLPSDKILSLGVVNGRNIWKTDLNGLLDWLEPVYQHLNERLWLAPSCSLLHVPVDLDFETTLDMEVKSWLAFAIQKLKEIEVLATALNKGRKQVADELDENAEAIVSRRQSQRVHKTRIKEAVKNISEEMTQRKSPYLQRCKLQKEKLPLPQYPTTTIGSFPQTAEIRKIRRDYRHGKVDETAYKSAMRKEIADCVARQESLGLDVLVHGEPERNDMVEYFGEQLSGYTFTRFGWVQSYGSRCVKPPVIFGDVERSRPMTIEWIKFAQSCTDKPVKGMLTGPVTMLNWSFVRDDQPRSETCLQLALAIREEVLELEQAGIRIIQIDEAALREGLPLRRSEWQDYLDFAVKAFRVAANGVKDATQIHTHMCYSEFNDIIESITTIDADVITIETSRSDMELLDAFEDFCYPNQIGPGVYDIHSPNVPDLSHMVDLMHKAAQRIPAEQLWVNPDCGLKTRDWTEVESALAAMVQAAKQLRAN